MTKVNLSKPAFAVFKKEAELIKADLCPMCGKPVGEFKDELSEREFAISGMCQACQDAVFGDEDDDY